MPDDNQTANLNDPAGLLNRAAVTEPRSAVEAASDPLHGGAPIYDSGWRDGDVPKVPIMTGYAPPPQGSQAYNSYLQAQIALQQAGASGNLNAPAAPTVKSGISRLRSIRDEAEKLIGEFEGFVGEMEGGAQKQFAGVAQCGSTVASGTAGAIHDAASDLKSVFSRLADLVKRAKAAHG